MECQDGLHNCSQKCIELDGGFSCACNDGYLLLNDGVSCEGTYVHTYINVRWICNGLKYECEMDL